MFAKRGFDAVGVQELVVQAGVTKPTLYHYFGSKQGVLEAVLSAYLTPFHNGLVEKSIYQRDIVKSLETITGYYLAFARTEPVFFRLWMATRFAPPESAAYQAVNNYLTKQFALISNLFKEAAEQHGNMRGRHDALSAAFLGMIFTHATMALQGELTIDESFVYRVVHQFMYCIFS